ncbi:acyl-CoA carboxylase subunit epsilon [Ornithinimicrobium tianjinense]|uniref:Acyl-CoA carboxylase epsilon subunit n=1 Tax=Ornithinimicrobium tianjinense TaxID=1195761 RepID=A0A917F4R1_9MICO|nr:acyl-CoA carboxylase subunit epsilon [Ornithinimicrobium tianjinense]GGF42777.1 hypothetical protein GCM10011366_08250 [Ornithinimicrobium tianjinense]
MSTEETTGDVAQPEPPVIRIERGNPTPEQLAALTVVLTAASGGSAGSAGDGSAGSRRTLWTARSRFARPRPAVGPGGWRASALPR